MRRLLFLIVCLTALPCVAADEQARRGAVAWPQVQAANFIDQHVFARLRELEIVPSPLSTDAEFLRRVSLTTIGQPPTSVEVRSFLADSRPDKRARKIEQLLAHPLHAAVWATRFSELTGNSLRTLEGPDELKPKRAKMWHDWLRKRFSENAPYDAIVRGILTATSRGGAGVDDWISQEAALINAARHDSTRVRYADRNGLELFWRRDLVSNTYPAEELAERVASSFLGVRINCARCHNHPFDRWTQQDYRQFVGIFAQVRFDMSPELRARLADRLDARRRLVAEGGTPGPPLPGLREVYLADVSHADQHAMAKALGGPQFAARDPRVALMDWLNEPRNPFFSPNLVNRVWAHHFGRGLVEPLDGFSEANAAKHPELLAALSTHFTDDGYDIRRLERLLLNSTTWQLSSEPNDTNRADRDCFSRAHVRMPPAETVIDMWQSATGITADFGDGVPGGTRAVEIGPSEVADGRWNSVLKLFGRSARTQTCDCAPTNSPSIRQTLALMSSVELLSDLSTGDLPALLGAGIAGEELLDELFLRTLSRLPTDHERIIAREAMHAQRDQLPVFEDILWGLVNSLEFITNH